MDSVSQTEQSSQHNNSSRKQAIQAEELFNQALELHQQGDALAAIPLYLQAHSRAPKHLDVCGHLALLYNNIGKHEEAIRWFKKANNLAPHEPLIMYHLAQAYLSSGQTQTAIQNFQKVLKVAPNHWEAAYNLGATYFAIGKTDLAIESYLQAADINPNDVDIYFNLGLAYKKAGRLTDALQAYHNALKITPNDAELHYNIALTYKKSGQQQEAAKALKIAITLQPNFGAALGHLGVIYLDQNKNEQAITCYRKLIAIDHNADAARHIISALTGETTECAPLNYVKDLFDDFSDHFEERLLVNLEYRTPWEMQNLLCQNVNDTTYGNLLDLGCGTGLGGQVFKDMATHKTGVDLSPKMLNEARKKNIYESLQVDDIIHFLQNTPDVYNLIIICDVLAYLGDLLPFFTLLPQHISPNGKILLSTEYYPSEGYKLLPTGRYAHSPDYIRPLLEKNGLHIMATNRTNIRKEKEKWIIGDLYLLSLAQ